MLHCQKKFLNERGNKQLLQVQSNGPDGMDGHHQWYTADRLTSCSKQQTSHGVVLPGERSKTFMSLLADLLSFVCMKLKFTVQLSQMLQRIVACSLNIVEHTLYYDDNIKLVGLTFVVQRSRHLGFEFSLLALTSVS